MEVVTPQEAQRLLDEIDFPSEKWEHTFICHLEESKIVGDQGTIIGVLNEGEGSHCTDSDLDLVAAAPELARTVAGLREEYFIEVELPAFSGGTEWVQIQDDGHQSAIYQTAEAAEHNRQKALELYGALRTRIVRRYVSEPEVIEP